MRRNIASLYVFSSAGVLSLLALKFAPAPFFWVCIAFATACFVTLFCVHGSWPRAAFWNAGVFAMLLAGGEAYFIRHEYTVPIYPEGGYFVQDDVLGWMPTKGIRAHAIKPGPASVFHGPEGRLFDVYYTIDSNGLRVAPPYSKDNLAGTILFFGCSFTFGEGLKDDETLPYQIGIQSGGKYRTYNFAFHAYNPAQMLGAVEHGMVSRILDSPPQVIYYAAIPGHVWRAAGRVAWGWHAPRFVMAADGSVHQDGNYEGKVPLAIRIGLGNRIAKQLDKSAMWRALSKSDSNVTDDDYRLYFAIVMRSKELLHNQYPQTQFRVLLWPPTLPQERAAYDKIRERFRQMGIPVDLVAAALPNYGTRELNYLLSPTDRHPNALANRLLAQHILETVARQQ